MRTCIWKWLAVPTLAPGETLADLQSNFPAPGIVPYVVQHELPEGGTEFTLAPGQNEARFDFPAPPVRPKAAPLPPGKPAPGSPLEKGPGLAESPYSKPE